MCVPVFNQLRAARRSDLRQESFEVECFLERGEAEVAIHLRKFFLLSPVARETIALTRERGLVRIFAGYADREEFYVGDSPEIDLPTPFDPDRARWENSETFTDVWGDNVPGRALGEQPR